MTWKVKEYKRLASTQLTAERLGRTGASEGTVVLAEEQTAGRGRFERRWASPKGGLYMSLVLRPARLDSPHLLTLVGALSVVEGVKIATGIHSGIRWPNDVMVKGRKVAGVLGTAHYSGSSPDYVVVGIGVNCNQSERSPGGVWPSSTSLMEALGAKVDLKAIRDRVLDSFDRIYLSWQKGADKEIMRKVASLLTTLGKEVEFKRLGLKPQTGVAQKLSDKGSLLVKVGGRRLIALKAERVEWLKEVGSGQAQVQQR
jgi:BirA family biotin operon repressor/biotin-[acetyl-CoA-carboxylase] ligase